MSSLPEVIDAEQLAAALGPAFDRRAVYRLHSHGLPRIQIGRRVFYDLAAVQAFLESRRVGEWQASERPDLRAVS